MEGLDASLIADAVEPADDATAAALLARAIGERHWQILHDHLLADGFVSLDPPRVFRAQRQGRHLRDVLMVDYRPMQGGESPDAAQRATLVLLVEADRTTGVQVGIERAGRVELLLRVDDTGQIVVEAIPNVPPPH